MQFFSIVKCLRLSNKKDGTVIRDWIITDKKYGLPQMCSELWSYLSSKHRMWWFFLCGLRKNECLVISLCFIFTDLFSQCWAVGFMERSGGCMRGPRKSEMRGSLKLPWPFIFNIVRFLTLWVEFYSADVRNIRLPSPASHAFMVRPQDVLTTLCFNFSSCKMIVSFATSPWADLKI